MDCFVFICGSGSKCDYCAALYPSQTPRKVSAEKKLTACAEMNLNFQFNDFCYFSVLLFFGTIVDVSVVVVFG